MPLFTTVRSRLRAATDFLREVRWFVRELRALPATLRAERAAREAEWRAEDARRREHHEVEMPAMRRAIERAVRANPHISIEALNRIQPQRQDYGPHTLH